MSGSRLVGVFVVLAAAWFGRGLVAPDGEPDEEPFVPVARVVDPEPVSTDWELPDGVRDPFAPLVLPSVPAEATPGADGE